MVWMSLREGKILVVLRHRKERGLELLRVSFPEDYII